MRDTPDRERRRLLQTLGSSALVAGLAGCSGGDSDDDGGTTATTTGETPTSSTDTEPDDDTDAETGGPLSVVTKLSSAEAADDEEFGDRVALSADGSTALVGAHRDDVGDAYGQGSAYVFEYADESWSQVNTLTASEGADGGDKFGSDVALGDSGAAALVGAEEDEDPNGIGGGSAYVFER